MLSTTTAIEILRALRAYQSVRLTDGRTGIVLAQLRGDVCVLADRLVLVVPRWGGIPIGTPSRGSSSCASCFYLRRKSWGVTRNKSIVIA